MPIEFNKEYQWQLIYQNGSVYEFLGTIQDKTEAIGKRWLFDKQEPVVTRYRDNLDKPFEELKEVKP